MFDAEETIGRELAAGAEIPALLGQLFKHVAANVRGLALAAGTGAHTASPERDALIRVASGYEEIADAAQRTADFMRTLEGLAPELHEAVAADQNEFLAWMAKKIELQRQLGGLLLEHAEQSAAVLELTGARSPE